MNTRRNMPVPSRRAFTPVSGRFSTGETGELCEALQLTTRTQRRGVRCAQTERLTNVKLI